jgi:polyhydroxybutyrate depolymerase
MRNSSRYNRSLRIGAVAAALLVGQSWGWSAAGTVKNSSGTALSGVAVTVKDSATIATTTSSTGAFTIGSTTGILLESSANASMGVQVAGGELAILYPVDGPLTLDLVDGQGRTLWSTTARASEGSARLAFPSGLRSGASFLRVRGLAGSFVAAVTTGPEGLRVASHIAAPRALATYPVLQFKKSGYGDTTYAMTSDMAAAVTVTMRDTTTSTTTCPSAKLSAGDQTKTISVKGVSRKYILHVPSGYTGTSAVPLLVDYHPIGGSASGQSSGTQYKGPADKSGAISVYPDGIAGTSGQAWNVQGCCNTADDTDFVRAMVAEIKTLACVNPKRIYAAGFSMGGGMTHYSACHLSDIFAAGAPAAFDLTQQNEPGCKPTHPMTMVMFRGTADPVVAYAGGHSALVTGMAIDFLGAKATFAKWAEKNQCTGSPSAEDSKGCSTYSTCAGGVQVTLCTKQGGGHEQGDGSVGWPILMKYTMP